MCVLLMRQRETLQVVPIKEMAHTLQTDVCGLGDFVHVLEPL